MTPEKLKFYSDLGSAVHFLESYMKRWGRMSVNAKEKYEEIRCYTTFGWDGLHGLIYPGYHHLRFGKMMRWINEITRPVFRLLNRIVVPYHKWLYGRAYYLAIQRWPNLLEPLCQGADEIKLIPGLREERFNFASSEREEYNEWDIARQAALQLAWTGEKLVAIWYKHHKENSGYYAYYYKENK